MLADDEEIMENIHIIRRGLLADDKRGWNLYLSKTGKFGGEILDEKRKLNHFVDKQLNAGMYLELSKLIDALVPSEQAPNNSPLGIIKKQDDKSLMFVLENEDSYKSNSAEACVWKYIRSLIDVSGFSTVVPD
jgi:hypothetical protein